MTLTTEHLTVAGIVIVVLIGAATLWWIVRAAIGFQDGHPIAWLFAPRDDEPEHHDEDHDSPDGPAAT